MDQFEKVERLVQKAGVSYEEAKEALEKASGDLLEAMIYLEKTGKTAAPEKSTVTTEYDSQEQYASVSEQVENSRRSNRGDEKWKEKSGKVKEFFKKAWVFLSTNYLLISRKGVVEARLPLWVMVIILLSVWHLSLIAFIVSLFFGCSYTFAGEADLKAADIVMDKAKQAADKIKEEYNKLG